ncbi:cupredoxin family copper-binding protein [Dyella sp. 2HG41-7]|uniref:cupredoxin domain-containing protein n=1 Tax=Dyella sp. 2HG41-7 TaxID=2883239 RepID=UPI001F37B00D|nr:cupredoxin family copper-binding protein [Dyella sp. 2HG41-7]
MSAIPRSGFTLSIALMLGCLTHSGAAADATPPNAKAYAIAIQNFAFAPKMLTIPVGTRVTWTNRDEEPHVITSAGAQFVSSKALDTGDTYGVTFSKPGTYAYYCSIHPMMVGTITVQ